MIPTQSQDGSRSRFARSTVANGRAGDDHRGLSAERSLEHRESGRRSAFDLVRARPRVLERGPHAPVSRDGALGRARQAVGARPKSASPSWCVAAATPSMTGRRGAGRSRFRSSKSSWAPGSTSRHPLSTSSIADACVATSRVRYGDRCTGSVCRSWTHSVEAECRWRSRQSTVLPSEVDHPKSISRPATGVGPG